ncbi:MAG TPA: AmmeMemoRadiSam system protein B [Patescibacteria group bacterium]|nr:AmmeMemoRadiSam system protein B [Patescibacteria group bacterium]
METLIGGALLPHPPIMVPEVGKQELDKIRSTVEAVEQVARILQKDNPETVVLITPHGPVFQDAVAVSLHPRLLGNLSAFSAPEVALGFATDSLMVRQICHNAERLGINLVELTEDLARTYRVPLQLDHGALVPLYYLHKAGFKGQLVHLSVGMLSYTEMYTFGKAVQAAIGDLDKPTAVIASGDLSHRLLPGAPAGYDPRGAEFDRRVVEALKAADVKALLDLDPELIAAAGECGLRPIFFLLGVMGGLHPVLDVLSYEGPFGVGYAVALFRQKNRQKNKEGEQDA